MFEFSEGMDLLNNYFFIYFGKVSTPDAIASILVLVLLLM